MTVPVAALRYDQTAPAWIDPHMPPRGHCELCGAADSRHRELDAITSRITAGETARSVADDHGLPVRVVGRITRELAHEEQA